MGTHPIFESDFDCLTDVRNGTDISEEVIQAPISPRGLMDEAIQFFQNGDEQNAKKLAKRVIKTSDDSAILDECGAVLAEVGENTLASEALRRSVTLNPKQGFEKYLTLGQLSQNEESLKFLQCGIELLEKEAPQDKRKLSKAFCNVADLYMTDLCMLPNAQIACKEAVDRALKTDSSNAEAHHLAASYLISSNKFDEARIKLREGISLWFENHEMVEDLEEAAEKEMKINPEDKLDVNVRMGALRLTVELEMWEEATQIARQISEEEVEDCEPRYFLAFSLFKSISNVKDPEEIKELKWDCFEAAKETKRLAQEAKRKRTSAVASDILGQIKELLEDLGPVEEPKMDDDEWEELENDEMQS